MRDRAAPVFAIALAALASVTGSRADEWPSRPIRAIIPLSPGSAADIVPRIVFEQLSAQLGQPIIVENKPGASGTIAARAVAVADPDGYTLLAHSSAHIIAPSTVANLPYDPIKDFAAVAPLGNLPSVLVISPSKNIKTVQELVALGKNPADHVRIDRRRQPDPPDDGAVSSERRIQGASDHIQGRPGSHGRGDDRPCRCVLRAGSGGTCRSSRTARFCRWR